MTFEPNLKFGQIITNNDIVEIFKCSPQAGMRRSYVTNSLVLTSRTEKSNVTDTPYGDHWKNGLLHYTGMGLKGDQKLDFAQNKTLLESNNNGVDVYLFETIDVNKYEYKGRVKLIGEPYQAIQNDENNRSRKVWMFPLKLLNENLTSKNITNNVLIYDNGISIPEDVAKEIKNNGQSPEDIARDDYFIEDKLKQVKSREKQSWFRGKVLSNFNNKCCISGIKETDLLVASHIIPWSDEKNYRLDPANGLCLSLLFDGLFDKGYITFTDDLFVQITPTFRKLSFDLQKILISLNGKQADRPQHYKIKKEYLKYHRDNIFIKT